MYFNKPSLEAKRYLLMSQSEFSSLDKEALAKAIDTLDSELRVMQSSSAWGEAYAAEDVGKVRALYRLAMKLID